MNSTFRKFYPLIFSIVGVFCLMAYQNCGVPSQGVDDQSSYQSKSGSEGLGNPNESQEDDLDETADGEIKEETSDIGICFLTRVPQKLTASEAGERAESVLDLDDEELEDPDSDFHSRDPNRRAESRLADREEAEIGALDSDLDEEGYLPVNSGLPNVNRVTNFKQGHSIMIGLRQVGPCGLLRANGQVPVLCSQNDENALKEARAHFKGRKFLAPHGRRICMKESTCLGLVNEHLRSTVGVMLAQNVAESEIDNSGQRFVTWKERYRRNKKTNKPIRDYCKETVRQGRVVVKRIYAHEEIAAELGKIDAAWAKLRELGLAP